MSAEALRVIRWPELSKMIGLHRSTIWRMENAGKFPRRIHLSEVAVGWLAGDVEKWLNERREQAS